MFNVIKEMHSLSSLPFNELCEIAVKEKSPISSGQISKVELITTIIVGRAINHIEWENEFKQKTRTESNPRAKYRLEDQYNNSHYLELTKDQEKFFIWCYNNNIDISNSELVEMDDSIIWEAP